MKLRLVRRYAQALFKLAARRDILYEVEAELSLVEKIFAGNEVCAFFENPSVPAAVKKETIARLVGKYVSGLVQNFLCHLTEKRRTEVLLEVIKAYRVLVKQANNIIKVQVTAAMPLAAQERKQLIAQLSQVTGKEIELEPRIEPQILGGLIIQIGDKRIDNSVVGKLANLKNHMLSKSF